MSPHSCHALKRTPASPREEEDPRTSLAPADDVPIGQTLSQIRYVSFVTYEHTGQSICHISVLGRVSPVPW